MLFHYVISSTVREKKRGSGRAGDGKMTAWRLWGRLPPLVSLRAAFIVQLEAGRSTWNHLVQVWALLCCFGQGKPLIGCQSSVLWSQHCSNKRASGHSGSETHLCAPNAKERDLLPVIQLEAHRLTNMHMYATWRRSCFIGDWSSSSHESPDLCCGGWQRQKGSEKWPEESNGNSFLCLTLPPARKTSCLLVNTKQRDVYALDYKKV